MVATLSLLLVLAAGEADAGALPVAPAREAAGAAPLAAPPPVTTEPASGALPVIGGPPPGPPPALAAPGLIAPPLDLHAAPPPDPFASEYLPPEALELGTGAGQLRLFAAAGLSGTAPDLAGAASLELMHFSRLGLRASAALELSKRTDAPQLMSVRLGAGAHLLPYERVDVTVFVDAGAAAADLFAGERRFAPAVVPGAALELSLSAHLVARLEAQALWAVLPQTGSLLRPGALVGLGWVL